MNVKYDVIYRYVSPDVCSGDGLIQRTRDNKELHTSIESLKFLKPSPQNIFIIHRGVPPNIKSNNKIIIIKEEILFEKFFVKYNIKANSQNSEPCKMCFHLIDSSSDYFLSMDDDYFIRRDVSIKYFMVNKNVLYYPRYVNNCHCPLLFKKKDYCLFIESMNTKQKKYFIRSKKIRNDVFLQLVPYLIKNKKAKYKIFNKKFIRGYFFGLIKCIILVAFFLCTNLLKPIFVTVNDNYDYDIVNYKRQINIVNMWKNNYNFTELLTIYIKSIFVNSKDYSNSPDYDQQIKIYNKWKRDHNAV